MWTPAGYHFYYNYFVYCVSVFPVSVLFLKNTPHKNIQSNHKHMSVFVLMPVGSPQ